MNVRIIAASNRPLGQDLSLGGFRPDLYYRLNGLHIVLPPLRERRQDIEALAVELLGDMRRDLGRLRPNRFALDAIDMLRGQQWPGNVRELEFVIHRLVTTVEQDLITAKDVIAALCPGLMRPGHPSTGRLPLRQRLQAVERQCIREALLEAGGNARHAADLCGMPASTFHRRLKQLGLDKEPQKKSRKPTDKPPEAVIAHSERKPLRIMIIDDDARTARAVGRTLQRDHDVTVATSGSEALAVLEDRQDFDIIICDVVMPEINGRDILDFARENFPEVAGKFLFLTGYAETRWVRDFLDSDDVRVIEKPVSRDRLLREIADKTS